MAARAYRSGTSLDGDPCREKAMSTRIRRIMTATLFVLITSAMGAGILRVFDVDIGLRSIIIVAGDGILPPRP